MVHTEDVTDRRRAEACVYELNATLERRVEEQTRRCSHDPARSRRPKMESAGAGRSTTASWPSTTDGWRGSWSIASATTGRAGRAGGEMARARGADAEHLARAMEDRLVACRTCTACSPSKTGGRCRWPDASPSRSSRRVGRRAAPVPDDRRGAGRRRQLQPGDRAGDDPHGVVHRRFKYGDIAAPAGGWTYAAGRRGRAGIARERAMGAAELDQPARPPITARCRRRRSARSSSAASPPAKLRGRCEMSFPPDGVEHWLEFPVAKPGSGDDGEVYPRPDRRSD